MIAETRAPACTPRTAPTTRRSAPGAARRTRHRHRRSRTPGPPATPTRPRGPHSGSARESSLPAGPRPSSSKPATYVRTPQPPPQTNPELRNLHPNRTHLSRPVEDCERCPALAGVRNLGLDDPGPGRPDSHCNFGGVGARRVVQVPMEKPASTASRRSSLSINALRSTAKVS